MSGSSKVIQREIKRICNLISKYYNPKLYEAVLLCEGDENSIDVKLYSKVYPHLYVIPAGGCTDVVKIIPSIRKRNKTIKIFGLIDRDAHSKKEIRTLEEKNGVYCTKLPFIENIICTPEVIKVICKYLSVDYDTTIKCINESLLILLTNKLKEVLPVNVSISKDDLIESVSFTVKLQDGSMVEKTINESSGLYTYREKSIANIVADAFSLRGRRSYYIFIAEMLENNRVSNDLIHTVKAYLPTIKASASK